MELGNALNEEILSLVESGCKHIQVDEPVFARKSQMALDYGIENIERCFDGVPDHVTRAVHICCGYPNALDSENYLKAPSSAYFELAAAMDESSVNAVSIEDAHRPIPENRASITEPLCISERRIRADIENHLATDNISRPFDLTTRFHI